MSSSSRDQMSDLVGVPSDPAAGRRSFAWVSPAGLCGLAGVAYGAILGSGPLYDNSFFTHLATGRMILESGSVPRTDVFSASAHGEPFVVQSWLASVAYASAEHLAGPVGIRLVGATLVAVLAGLVWALTAPAVSLLPRLGLAGAALGVGAGMWTHRPLVFGLVCLAVMLVSASGRAPAWVCGPAAVFWVWSHGSWPLGLAVLAVALAGTVADTGRRSPATRRHLRCVAFAAAGALAAVLASPVGASDTALFPVRLLARSALLSHVQEWKPPVFGELYTLCFAAVGLLALGALVRRPSWRSGLIAMLALGLSASALRNLAPASLMLVAAGAPGLAGVGEVVGARRSRSATAGAVVLCFAAACCLCWVLAHPSWLFDRYPEASLVLAREAAAVSSAPDARPMVVAPDFVGNFADLAYGADANVFVDDRFDFLPDRLASDYLALVSADPPALKVLGAYGDPVVLWPAGEPLSGLLAASPAWSVRAAPDRGWVLACHVGSPGCAQLSETLAPVS